MLTRSLQQKVRREPTLLDQLPPGHALVPLLLPFLEQQLLPSSQSCESQIIFEKRYILKSSKNEV